MEKITIDDFRVQLKDFQFSCLLGSGAYGNVYRVKHIKSNKILALKSINKMNIVRA